MRFVPPVAALATGRVDFDGDLRARERPIGEMLRALQTLGVAVDPSATTLPFVIDGSGVVEGGVVTLDASASSQFVSALLLAGARYRRGVDVRHDGKAMPSAPHVAMTVDMLRARGVAVDDSEPDRWVVGPGPIAAVDIEIEPDLSNAAAFLAAAAVTGGSVTIEGWPSPTTQAGDSMRGILQRMGATVELASGSLTVTGPERLEGVDIDLHGVAHLRGHETDRLAALATELGRLGCDVQETEDGLRIRPQPMREALIHTYSDHRMAQAAAVLGLVVPGVRLDDVMTTAKTHPDFVAAWRAMLG
jgi:3-phosphoshikimate 1-carboxyvinyltransferase